MKLLDRYLMKQIAGPFLFGVIAFVLLFVSANILFKLTELVSQLGLSLWVAGELFLLWLPEFIVFTFPLATLVAILIVFGRMSGDSELVAMFAGGVSFRRLVAPLLAFGLLVSVATSALNEFVVPASKRRADDIVREATLRAGKEYEQGLLKREVVKGSGRVIIADKLNVSTGEMIRPTILLYETGRLVSVIDAEKARWRGSDWQLINGTSVPWGTKYPTSTAFPVADLHYPKPPEQLEKELRDPAQLTFRELQDRIQSSARDDKPTTDLELTLYHKFSIPFASLVFALIAPALGIRSHRGSGSIGMGIAILIGFAYYVVYNYLTVVAQQGGITPFWAAWLPNLVAAGIGIVLILRVRR